MATHFIGVLRDAANPNTRTGHALRLGVGAMIIAALAACPFSPVGSNKAGTETSKVTTAPIATPDPETDKVTLEFKVKEGDKATFAFKEGTPAAPEDVTIPEATVDADAGTATAEIDASKLTEPGLYFVEMTIDDGESVSATLPFIKPVAADAGSGTESTATDTEKTEEE